MAPASSCTLESHWQRVVTATLFGRRIPAVFKTSQPALAWRPRRPHPNLQSAGSHSTWKETATIRSVENVITNPDNRNIENPMLFSNGFPGFVDTVVPRGGAPTNTGCLRLYRGGIAHDLGSPMAITPLSAVRTRAHRSSVKIGCLGTREALTGYLGFAQDPAIAGPC